MPSKLRRRDNRAWANETQSLRPATPNREPLASQQTSPGASSQQICGGPGSLPPHGMLQLQRAFGNRAVSRLLNPQPGTPQTDYQAQASDEIADLAFTGIAGSGHTLPNLSTIQLSFGRHDISGIRAHTDAAAIEATEAMGAEAYATGRDVVLGRSTDLHTVAHEAAHVVQQRAGVQLRGGIGQAGDHYERHANAVADRVVRGQSAEALLDQYAPRGASHTQSSAPVVQYLFGTIRQNLIEQSRHRATNPAYLQILRLLQQGKTLQANPSPTVAQYDQMLALIPQIRAQLPAAASTRWFKRGKERDAALNAMNTSLDTERDAIQRDRTAAQERAVRELNTAGPGYTGPLHGLGARAFHMSSTGVQQGLSGSYFDRGPSIGGVEGPIRGIFKPESQEGGARSGRDKRGAGAIREVLGDALDQHLHLGVVPRTRMIAISDRAFAAGADQRISGSGDDLQVGSYQEGVKNVAGNIDRYVRDADAYRAFDVGSLQKMAILDMISLNKDRHGGNILFNNASRMWAIDQGEMAPSAKPFKDKFDTLTDASGWAWADLPESEQGWTPANLDIISRMDPEGAVDHLARQAQIESSRMAAITGQNARDTHLSAQSIAMMKYGARTLKLCASAGLTPAQTETIYTKRGKSRAATTDRSGAHTKKTARDAGGGEFVDFITATFFKDSVAALIAQSENKPDPPEQFTYGSPACEDAWNAAMVKGLTRVASQDPTKAVGVRRVLEKALLPSPVPRPPLAPITTNSPTADARRLWAHMTRGATAVALAHLDEHTVMDRIWERGTAATRQRILEVLTVQGDQLRMSHLGYILEAVDPSHRMNLPDKLVVWYRANERLDFWGWLARGHNPAHGPTADYRAGRRRDEARVSCYGGKLRQGDPASPMNTGGGEGWTVVLANGQFYSRPKSDPADPVKTQHSSFMAGLPVDAAAMMRVSNGTLEHLNNHSGHYAPTISNMSRMIVTFMEEGVSMDAVIVKDDHGLGPREGREEFHALEYLRLAKEVVKWD